MGARDALNEELFKAAGEDCFARRNHLAEDPDRGRRTRRLAALVKKGADPNARDSDGTPVLFYLVQLGDLSGAKALCRLGAKVTALDAKGCSALHATAWNRRVELLAWLVKAGVPVDHRDKEGGTALADWAYSGNGEGVRMLAKLGADVRATSNYGGTPLHSAALCENMETLAALLELGADPTARNSNGQTPMDVARSRNRMKALKLLGKYAKAPPLVSAEGGDPIAQLQALAQKLGRESADTAVNSSDLEYAAREEGLDPDDIPFDQWEAMYRQIVQEAMRAMPQAPIRKAGGRKELLDRLFEAYGVAYDQRLRELRGKKRTRKKAAPRTSRTASRRR